MCRTYPFLVAAILFPHGSFGRSFPEPSVAAQAMDLIATASATGGFEENKGQVLTTTGDPATFVRYRFTHGNVQLFLLDNGIAFQFDRTHYPEGYVERMDAAHRNPQKLLGPDLLNGQLRTESYRMDMLLEGADPDARISTEGRSSDYTNYYTHDVLGVHTYGKVIYHDVWPGIDWVIYTTEGASPGAPSGVKYDFVVRPGADPSLIRLRFEHHEELYVDAKGGLVHGNRLGRFTEQAPASFQARKEVATQFVLTGNVLRFAVDDYDRSTTLVIDPARTWGTYYGGSDFDVGRCSTVGNDGNVYLVGYTRSPSGIATAGGHQTAFGGGSQADAFLTKFAPDGARLWGTYYGGAATDAGSSCVVDADGNVYMSGTSSTSTPGVIASGGHQNTHGGGEDAFLVKFTPDGTRIWGTYYGGTVDDAGGGCALDSEGNVYLSGYTQSSPVIPTPGAHQTAFGGTRDAFLVKFDSDGVRQWGTYYGGTNQEFGFSCTVDGDDNVYLAGWTRASNPVGVISTTGCHQPVVGGGDDAFLVKFDPDGVRLWGTYYGWTMTEQGFSCSVDGSGNVYLAGFTSSPTSTAIASGGHQNTRGGGDDAFLVKFNPSGVRQWGTYYGGTGVDGVLEPNSTAVDGSGNVYLIGYTTTSTGTVIASGGHQNTHGGDSDAFLVKFNPSGVRQWGTYYGGSGSDYGMGCTVSGDNVYLAGQTRTATGTAIASGGHQNTFGGGDDAFLVKFHASWITTSIGGGGPFCAGGAVNVPYSANTPVNAGNVFTAQLSNASGDFTTPVDIGSVGSMTSGTISCTIPLSTPSGTGYRIRVVSSNPVRVGDRNGVDLTVLTPVTWYADTDEDELGDPDDSVLACEQPDGYVADNTDPCPSVADVEPGDDCDDGFANTVFDVYGASPSCGCAGTPCTQSLTIEFQTDGNPSQISWEIRQQGTNDLVQSGPPGSIVPPNGLQTASTCVPNGCYYLRVIDSGGDGIVNGGYILRTAGANGIRLIDNRRNFTNLAGGPPDVSQIANGEGFCVPFGTTTQPLFTSCDKMDWVTGEYVVCSAVPAITGLWNIGNTPAEATSGYEFQIFNPNGGYIFNRFRSHNQSDGFAPDNATRACHMKINNWAAANQIPANVLMNVHIRTRNNGSNGNWGPVCRFMINPTAAACPLTNLMDIPGDANLSCNSTRAWGNGNYIHARPVSGATQYQWRFRLDGESFVTIRTTTTYFIQLNWITLPLQDGKTYTVEVRAFKNGAWCVDAATPANCGFTSPCWVAWNPNKPCLLTIDNTPFNGGGENFTAEEDNALRIYPNPNRGDQLYLSFDRLGTTSSGEPITTVSVDITDMFGKRVSARTIAVTDGFINTVLDLDGDMANGMYMVNITAGEQRFTERLVIQR